jgi:hypothetical protein
LRAVRIELLENEPEALPGGALYRALRGDVAFRFVVVAPGSGYEIAHEDGDADGGGGVLLVEPYEVAPEDDEAFLAAWREAHAELAGHRGYLGARLYRSEGRAAPRWVETARWSSPLMVSRARARGDLYLRAPE